MASTYLRKAFSTTGTSRQKFSLSMWIKRGAGLGAEQMLCECYSGSSAKDEIWLQSNDTLNFVKTDGGGLATTTLAMLRDTSAWYHIVISADSTQVSNSNRIKIYINGVQQTLAQQDTIVKDSNFQFGASGAELTFGTKNNLSWYFNGSMANVQMVDGQQYGPEYFGSTDSNTGIWTPEATSTISDYGTNGFKLKMDTTSPGADTSGKGNTFTPSGTPTLLQGSPSNVYANFNPLYKSQETLAYGNTASSLPSSGEKFGGACTIAVSTGKWYAEFKMNSGSSSDSTAVGIYGDITSAATANQGVGKQACSICYKSNGEKGIENVFSSYGATYTAGNVIGVALDMTSSTKNITFYKDGATQGNITFTIEQNSEYSGFMHMAANSNSSSHGSDWWANFGEGFFGTTAAGTNADGNGQGLFAYAVPSGYYALNTKNLEAYG